MDPLYREIIIEHFKNPQNYGLLEKAQIDMQDSNPLCGDEIRMMANIQDGKISEISFVAQGCAISKASASILTEEIKNRTVKEFIDLPEDNFLKLLEIDLSPARLKCALLGYSTLKKGIQASAKG